MKKTPEQIVEGIPEDMRGHVFHLLGQKLGHKTTGPHTDDGGAPSDPLPPSGGHGPGLPGH